MLVLFSGEGSSDVGQAEYGQSGICAPGHWTPGPMALLAAQIFEDIVGYDLLSSSAYYISESSLMDYTSTIRRRLLSRPGLSLYHKKATMGLASLALALGEQLEQPVCAVFFRDCDGTNSSPRTRCNTLRKSISGPEGGFESMGLHTGVAMLPKPKSEAWLLCALREPFYQNCEALEDESGNDNGQNPLKAQLSLCLQNYCVRNLHDLFIPDEEGHIHIEARHISMPSFLFFKEEFCSALRRTETNWRMNNLNYPSYTQSAAPYLPHF